MTKCLIVFGSLLLAGCSTFPKLERGAQNMMGLPISAVEQRLGYPDAEQVIGDRKVYVWSRAYNATVPTTSTTPVSGTVNGRSYSGTVTMSGYRTAVFDCKLRFVVNANDVVISWDFDGNEGGCAHYSRALSPSGATASRVHKPHGGGAPTSPVDDRKGRK